MRANVSLPSFSFTSFVPGITLFVCAFAIPLILVIRSGNNNGLKARIPADKPLSVSSPKEQAVTSYFSQLLAEKELPNTFASGPFVVGPGTKLNPTGKGLYRVGVGISFDRLDEKQVLISKVDRSHRAKPGFELALLPEGARVRPQLYWKNTQGKGSWFDFSDVELKTKTNYLFIISFKGGQYLGLHLLDRAAKSVELLGGYDLGEYVVPHTSAPLRVGRTKDIGTFGIFSELFVSQQPSKTEADAGLRELSRGSDINAVINSDEILTWSKEFAKGDLLKKEVSYGLPRRAS